ncbi:Hypothetical protein (Fragment), partial [Durusdinium trenchii]
RDFPIFPPCLDAVMAVYRELWREGLVLALLGFHLGLPVTQLPKLQEATFQQPFLITGLLVSIKGALNTVLAPLIGARVDRGESLHRWLRWALLWPTAPYVALLATAGVQSTRATEVWTFSIVDMLSGLSGPALCLCFTLVPRRTTKLTEGYALLNFALSSGL